MVDPDDNPSAPQSLAVQSGGNALQVTFEQTGQSVSLLTLTPTGRSLSGEPTSRVSLEPPCRIELGHDTPGWGSLRPRPVRVNRRDPSQAKRSTPRTPGRT